MRPKPIPCAETAGRDLDARVAEVFFGYQWWRSRSSGRRCIYAPGRNPEHMTVRADMTEPLVADWNSHAWTPAYSSDIAAAWLVLDALDAAEWGLTKLERSGDRWFIDFAREGRFVSVMADSAPLAICRAALQTVTA